MTDKKITQLTELTSIASDDVFPIVDVSDTTDSINGTTKYVQYSNLGSGDVSGPASAVDDNIVTFNLTTGKLIQDSGINISDVSSNTSARHVAVTVTDTAEIDFTLTGQDIQASIKSGSIDETKLDTSVNASLDLADSALQSGDNISELTNDSGFTTNIGTVTSVAALTIGTTGTDLSSTVATGTTTPVITLQVPTASAANRGALSSTDWSTFNSKQDALTFGIANTNAVDIDSTTVADNDYAKFTPNGLEGRSYSEVLSDIGAAATAQTFYIGTTQVAINRASGTLTLAGLTFTTPNIGTPSAGVLTNCTGTASGLTAGAVTGFTPASGSLTLSGADAVTLTTSAATNVTLPTTGTLMANLSEDTTPELGGNLDLNGKALILTGQTVGGSDGDLVYVSAANTWSQADADTDATCSNMLGIRLSATSVHIYGPYTTTGLTAGALQYVSETAGDYTETAPTTSTSIQRFIGTNLSTTVLFFNPSSTFIEVP